jgi:hypothetical protein
MSTSTLFGASLDAHDATKVATLARCREAAAALAAPTAAARNAAAHGGNRGCIGLLMPPARSGGVRHAAPDRSAPDRCRLN